MCVCYCCLPVCAFILAHKRNCSTVRACVTRYYTHTNTCIRFICGIYAHLALTDCLSVYFSCRRQSSELLRMLLSLSLSLSMHRRWKSEPQRKRFDSRIAIRHCCRRCFNFCYRRCSLTLLYTVQCSAHTHTHIHTHISLPLLIFLSSCRCRFCCCPQRILSPSLLVLLPSCYSFTSLYLSLSLSQTPTHILTNTNTRTQTHTHIHTCLLAFQLFSRLWLFWGPFAIMDDVTSQSTSPPSFILNEDKHEELADILRSKLIECGWRDKVANMCRTLIQQHGIENIRLEQIMNEVKQEARSSVPDRVKVEMLDVIRKFNR